MLKELLKQNRSTRGFDESQTIDHHMLIDWIASTRYCASASNRQPLKYGIIDTKAEVEELLTYTRWASSLHEPLPYDGQHPVAFIAILQDQKISDGRYVMADVGIAAQTILLSACEAGYNGCMIGAFHPQKVQAFFGTDLNPVLLIALGKGTETIELVDSTDSITYYRKNGVHYVPKRKLDEIIVERKK